MAYATVPRDDLVVLTGEPSTRRSSEFGERWFCRDCGSPLAMLVTHQPGTIDFAIATLDDPETIVPGFHIWTGGQIGWFDTADQLDRYERFRPDTVGLTDQAANIAADGPRSDNVNPLAPPIAARRSG
jgi:hypothetical protein